MDNDAPNLNFLRPQYPKEPKQLSTNGIHKRAKELNRSINAFGEAPRALIEAVRDSVEHFLDAVDEIEKEHHGKVSK